MNLLLNLLEFLWDFIRDPLTLELCRIDEKAFIRKTKKLSFPLCLIIGLTHFTVSLDYAMDEFFTNDYIVNFVSDAETLESPKKREERKRGRKKNNLPQPKDHDLEDLTVTKSAYIQDRKKYNYKAYQQMFITMRDMIDENYRSSNTLQTKYDKQILAVDGSRVNLPKRKDLLKVFGGGGPRAESPLGLMTLIYDTLNDIVYEAVLDKYTGKENGEREQAKALIRKMAAYLDLTKTVFIFDRGYYSKEFLQFLDSYGTYYIFRLSSTLSFLEYIPIGSTQFEVYPGIIKRIIKIRLKYPDGNEEIESLLTNWNEPSEEMFKELYFLRWPVETEIDTIKNKIEMPNFNGYLVNIIYQNFWICMVIANLIGVILRLADEKIHSRNHGHMNKYKYQANISDTADAIHIWLPKILLCETKEKIKERIPYLLHYASQSEEPYNPGRNVPRKIVHYIKYFWQRKHH